MSKRLFQHLSTQDIRLDNVHKVIYSISESKLSNIIQGCLESIEIFYLSQVDTNIHNLSFTPSSEFVGSSSTCQNSICVNQTAEQLLRFSTLYASKIYMWEPFQRHQDASDYSKFGRHVLANDIMTLLIYKQAIIDGIIVLVTQDIHFCPNCYSEFMNEVDRSYKELGEQLKQKTKKIYFDNCTYHLSDKIDNRMDWTGIIEVESKYEKYTIHKPTTTYYNETNPLLNKIKKRKSKRIYKNELSKFQGAVHHSYKIADKIISQNYLSEITKSHFLTPNEVDYEIISAYNKELNNTKHLEIFKSLSHSLPYLYEVPIEDVLELRKKDGEAFVNYRYEMQKLYSKIDSIEGKNIGEYFGDIIKPKLNQIDITVANFKKAKRKTIIHNAIPAIGYLTAGIFGMLPQGFAQSLAALGGFNHSHNMLKEIKEKLPSDVRNDKFFFLWKLQPKNTSR